jgi:hypothetical protein
MERRNGVFALSVAAFPQPLYAKTVFGEDEIIVLGIIREDEFLYYVVMYNDPAHRLHGMTQMLKSSAVRFEHFYWPVIEPADSNEHEHPQDPALKYW